MKRRVEGLVALVVGAGSDGPGWSNGRAAAVLYARHGAKVFAVDRDPASLEETRRLVAAEGADCVAHVADATRAADVQGMVAACLAVFGRIDILHNNVGAASKHGPVETSEAEWDAVFDANVRSAFLTCKHVLPLMAEQGRGAIVNISSLAGSRWAGSSKVAYAASKAALDQFTRSVALEYAGRGIRCNAVVPGLVDVPMVHSTLARQGSALDAETVRESRRRVVPLGTLGDAWDVAHAALYLASDEAGYVTGALLPVDGGMATSFVLPAGGGAR